MANDLAQIDSRYKVSTGKLKSFVEVREKVVSTPSSIFPISKTGRADDTCESFENFEFEIFAIDNLSGT